MPFDSTTTRAMARELQGLVAGRISRVHQPRPDRIILQIYAQGQNLRLLLSVHPQQGRVHITEGRWPNPPHPPMFCMLLRKYLEGGRIMAIEQVGLERILELSIQNLDELGNPVTYRLIAEIMGKHSNLILVNAAGRIIDAIKRVTEEVNRYRELLPGLAYVAPPPQQKLAPAAVTAASLAPGLEGATGPAWRFLLDQVEGLGPLMAKELAHRALGSADAPVTEASLAPLAQATQSWSTTLEADSFSPVLLYLDSQLKDYAVLPLTHWPGEQVAIDGSLGQLLDLYYSRLEEAERMRSLSASLGRVLRAELQRLGKKLSLQEEALAKAEGAEQYRIQGELLTSYLHQAAPGADSLTVTNYYDGRAMVIPLDPALSAAENAQALYRRYQKAKSGRQAILGQLEQVRAEMAYLEQVEAMLQAATSLPDLEEIRTELADGGYLKGGSRPPASKKREEPVAPPLQFRSSDGYEIWVGRNNRQNEYLTLRLAAPGDLWFHAKEVAGAHVILRVPPGSQPPDRSLAEAAQVAAFYSKGRDANKVAVDYTERKHVKKPGGARPGMVIYERQKTVYVTPAAAPTSAEG